mgnify:FL=1
MVQIIPRTPSVGETLSQTLGALSGMTLGQQLGSYYKQQEIEQKNAPLQEILKKRKKTTDYFKSEEEEKNQIEELSDEDIGILAIDNPELAKILQKQKTIKHSQDVESYKLSKDYREKLLEGYQGYHQMNMRLDRMAELNKDDKLSTPALAYLFDKLDLPLGILQNPDSEEFQKLSQDLMKNITTYFGNRINVVEVQNFLKTIPTLMNSKEGRERIIKNLKLLMKPQELTYKSYQKIRKKSDRLPLDIQEQVAEVIEPELNKLSKEFNQGSGPVRVLRNGEIYEIPPDLLQQALSEGAETL